jgi:hypothetical protein
MIKALISRFYPRLRVDSPEKGLFKIRGANPHRVLSVLMYGQSRAERVYLSQGRLGEWVIFEDGQTSSEEGSIMASTTGRDLKEAINALLEIYGD